MGQGLLKLQRPSCSQELFQSLKARKETLTWPREWWSPEQGRAYVRHLMGQSSNLHELQHVQETAFSNKNDHNNSLHKQTEAIKKRKKKKKSKIIDGQI